jgi:NAD(P)-dependent dehydrogenase (short-subunit alcohol dehydrogenase family)
MEGRCALVTGAAGGIGKAVVRAMTEAGARVASADVTQPEVPEDGVSLTCDFHSERVVEEVMAQVVGDLGALDVVVNCMGILVPNRPATETPLGELERALAVNANGVFLSCKYAARQMIALKRGGAMTNITSLAELATLPNQSAYTASKGALASLTRSLALDWGHYGIRVNSIAPGPVETPMTARFYADPDVKGRLVGRIPLGRLGQPEDVAGAALFLSAPAADFITGHTLIVDGGWRAGEPNLALE